MIPEEVGTHHEIRDFGTSTGDTCNYRIGRKKFGFEREELMGHEVKILSPERFQESHRAQRAGFFAHAITRLIGPGIDVSGLRKVSREFPVEISLSAIPDPQGVLVANIIRDVTQRRQIEEKPRDADREKDEFLAMLSHELRNPLEFVKLAIQEIRL